MRALIVCLILLAGCTEDLGACDDCAGTSPVVTETDVDVLASVDAPEWSVGDVFEQHMFFGSQDAEGRHIKTMVVDVGPQGATIATSDPEAASFDAVYDYPILGAIGPGLETTGFGSDWGWMYAWPLTDGAAWTGTLEQALNWNSYNFTDYELTFTATFDDGIDTAAGDAPGYWIEGVTADGETLLRYNYVPEVGWFSHFWMYDLETPEEDIQFHAMSMGTSHNYTGEYWLATAETLVDHFYGHFPDPGAPQDSVQGEPVPQPFHVTDEAERLMGIAVPIAVGGQTEVRITDPAGQETVYQYQQYGTDGPGFDVFFIDDEAIAGDGEVRIIPTAAFAGAYVWLSSVDLSLQEM